MPSKTSQFEYFRAKILEFILVKIFRMRTIECTDGFPNGRRVIFNAYFFWPKQLEIKAPSNV